MQWMREVSIDETADNKVETTHDVMDHVLL